MTATDDDEVEPVVQPRPWSVPALLGIVTNFGCNLAESVASLFGDLSGLCTEHDRVAHDRADAVASLHRDLESL